MSFQAAQTNAQHQLAVLSQQPDSREKGLDHLGGCSAVLWWDDATPVFEFPILDKDGQESGHIIASGDPRFLPILEYALSPGRPSQLILMSRVAHVTRRGHTPHTSKIYYFSPLEWIVRFDYPDHVEYHKHPEGAHFRLDHAATVTRPPGPWTPDDAAQAWTALPAAAASTTLVPEKLLAYRPVRYNQACNAYPLTDTGHALEGGDTECSPACISGCAPVAAAMLASAWKRSSTHDSTKIFGRDPNWQLDWKSPIVPDPSQSAEVAAAIWDFHAFMKTTCDGSTGTGKINEAMNSVFFGRWGAGFKFGEERGVEFVSDVMNLIDKGQPFLFSATGDWNAFAASLGAAGNIAGHSVVCYGYRTSDQTMMISLGWGRGTPDKWVALKAFKETICNFRVPSHLDDATPMGPESRFDASDLVLA